MGIAKITRNYQITIPKDVRELKNLNEGDTVIFSIEGKKVDIVKMEKDVLKSAAGLWSKTKETGLEYEKKIRENWKKRINRETR